MSATTRRLEALAGRMASGLDGEPAALQCTLERLEEAKETFYASVRLMQADEKGPDPAQQAISAGFALEDLKKVMRIYEEIGRLVPAPQQREPVSANPH